MEVKEVTGLDVAFGCRAMELLPRWEDIPMLFRESSSRTKWGKVAMDWFYLGIKNAEWTPKPGVDTGKALAMIKACLGSFEPSHEHKMSGVAYMLCEFFEDVKYTPAKTLP